MGRTKRNRNRRTTYRNLDLDEKIINLKSYMTKNNWINHLNLKLRDFPQTGRGVFTKKHIQKNDVLITVPFNLMITLKTLSETDIFEIISPNSKLKIHDLLTLFLVIEKNKKDASKWKDYINSLPNQNEIPNLPGCFLSNQNIELIPDEELRGLMLKSRKDFRNSWLRLEKSINPALICSEKYSNCVLDRNTFSWAFILVNTRAVYVDPQVVRDHCKKYPYSLSLLSDEPCMALCPYLDMFNHSFRARTKAELKYIQGQLCYQLQTLTSCRKYNQIFISYGSHDNTKLLLEYGFFIPANNYDVIRFCCTEILDVLGFNLGENQRKFLEMHDLNNSLYLYVNKDGLSFNLKAFLFVVLYPDFKDFSGVIYKDNYPGTFLDRVKSLIKLLIAFKLRIFCDGLKKIEGCVSKDNRSLFLVSNYLQYRKNYIKDLIISYDD